MNVHRRALALSAVLAATVADRRRRDHRASRAHAAPRRPPPRRPPSWCSRRRCRSSRRETDAARLGRRPLRLGDARDRRRARLDVAAGRGAAAARCADARGEGPHGKQQLVVLQPAARRPHATTTPRGGAAMSARSQRLAFRRRHDCSAAVTAGHADGRLARPALAPGDAKSQRVRRRCRDSTQRAISRGSTGGGTWVTVDVRLVEALRLARRARAPRRTAASIPQFSPRSSRRATTAPSSNSTSGRRGRLTAGARERRRARRTRRSRAHRRERRCRPRRYRQGLRSLACARRDARGVAAPAGRARRPRRRPRAPGSDARRRPVANRHHGSPHARRHARTLLLSGGGVATSGRDIRRFGPGRSLHHLIDPSTGSPAKPGPLAVTVVAPDAAEAEAHATALAISELRGRGGARRRQPAHLCALVPHAARPFALGALPIAHTRVLVRAA